MSPRAELQQLLSKLACDSESDATSIDSWANANGKCVVATVVTSREPYRVCRVYCEGALDSTQAGLAVLEGVKCLMRGRK